MSHCASALTARERPAPVTRERSLWQQARSGHRRAKDVCRETNASAPGCLPAYASRRRGAAAAAAAAAASLRQPGSSSSSSSGGLPPLDLLGFTLILDDIVSPQGESNIGQLGGGGPQTLWGFQLQRAQAARVALAAGVGPDLPPSCRAWLQYCGIDDGALVLHSGEGCKTPRAWQILEEDGRRHEIWRTPFTPQLVRMLRPALAELAPQYRLAGAYHVGVHPQEPSLELLRELRAAADSTGGLVSAETFAAASEAVPAADLRAFMAELDVFSPNEAEAASMLFAPSPGHAVPELLRREPRRLTEPFLEAGAQLVALRRGPLGAVVQDRDSGAAILVPAFPGTRVVDPTGSGNAFCGALLAALTSGEGLASAAAWGCAAGSLMAECRGTASLAPTELKEEAVRRQAALLALAEEIR